MAEPLMNPEKVLIVEDEDNERTGLAELISAWGYRTETARDGLEALEKISAWSPSIVVTDLKMPRMSGMELIERLDSQPTNFRYGRERLYRGSRSSVLAESHSRRFPNIC